MLDVEACKITSDGRTQHLQPQVRSVLLCLVRHSGEVVSKALLVEQAWSGRHSSDEATIHCISLLRRHFAECGARELIETIPESGYRLGISAQPVIRPKLEWGPDAAEVHAFNAKTE